MTRNDFYPLVVIVALFAALNVPAQNSRQDSALKQTQALLLDKNQRAAAIAGSPEAQLLNVSLQQLFPSAQSQDQVFGLSAEIMGELAEKFGNDPAQISAALEEAKKNPEGFYKSLRSDQQQQISGVADRIPSSNKEKPLP